jgi:hypothetical protein
MLIERASERDNKFFNDDFEERYGKPFDAEKGLMGWLRMVVHVH